MWLWRTGTFRALAWTAILVELLFFTTGGKAYYVAAIYPLLYAAGAVWLEQAVRSRLRQWAWMAATAVISLLEIPFLLPVLPADVMARTSLLSSRPDFAEMYGWPDMAHDVAAAHSALPPADRRGAMILAANYGEAGALDLYGPGLGQPRGQSPPDLLLLARHGRAPS